MSRDRLDRARFDRIVIPHNIDLPVTLVQRLTQIRENAPGVPIELTFPPNRFARRVGLGHRLRILGGTYLGRAFAADAARSAIELVERQRDASLVFYRAMTLQERRRPAGRGRRRRNSGGRNRLTASMDIHDDKAGTGASGRVLQIDPAAHKVADVLLPWLVNGT